MKLKCETDGVPTPNVTWFNPDGNKLERGTAVENTVDVIMAKDGDFGDYKCIADNGLPPADTVIFTVQQISEFCNLYFLLKFSQCLDHKRSTTLGAISNDSEVETC